MRAKKVGVIKDKTPYKKLLFYQAYAKNVKVPNKKRFYV